MTPENIVTAAVDATGALKTEAGGTIAKGVWSLVVVVSLAVLAFLPKWRVLGIGQRKDDIDRLMARVEGLENDIVNERKDRAQEVSVERTARVKSQLQMSYLVAAFGMVSAELERQDEGNVVIRQARQMIARATHEDDPFGDLVSNLDHIKDV